MKTIMHIAGYSTTAVIAFICGALITFIGTEADTSAAPARDASTATATDPGQTITTTATRTATQTKTATTTAPAPEPAHDIPGDGTFAVGVDIEPDTYASAPAASGNYYWARLSGGDGSDDIIDNYNSSGQSLVTIAATDKFFESSGCSDWTKR